MTKPRTESALPDVLLALGAAALTFAGHDPAEVARRAESVASGLRRMRDRLEGLAEQHARTVVGCRLPDACDCILCTGREAERKAAARRYCADCGASDHVREHCPRGDRPS